MFLNSTTKLVCMLALLSSAAVFGGQAIDLTVTYTDGVTHIAPGATLIYTINVTNNSAVTATNVTATATIPNVLSFTSSPNGGTFANGTVTFTNVTVPANSNTFLQFNVAVVLPLPAGTPHNFSSTASASVDPLQGNDPNLADNSATDTDALDLSPDPVICTLTDNLACTYANGVLTFTAEACNIGNIGISGVVVTNTIPVGTTFISADNGGTFANGVVTWPTYSIPGGVHTFRSVTVKVNSPLPPGVTTIVDNAHIMDDGLNGTDANPGNNSIMDTDCIMPSSSLVITKVVDITNPNIADTVTYSVVVTNNGPDAATNVTVTDMLPAGLTLVSETQTTGNFDTTNGLWTVGGLANGASATLTLSASVNAGAPAAIVNTACVANTPEINSNSANNCASVTITPSCARKPTIVSGPSATPAVPVVGVPETFTIVTNDNGSGLPVTVTWDFGDGTMSIGATVTHTYTTPGSYTVKATVANACGGLGTSAQLALSVLSTPAPFQCSLLNAAFNLANVNRDTLSLVAQVPLGAGFSPAGQKVLVQINNLDYSVTLDSQGRYKDASHSVAIKPLGSTFILALKISHSALRTALVPGLAIGAKSAEFSQMPFLITIGSQSYGNNIDTFYVGKRTLGTLKK